MTKATPVLSSHVGTLLTALKYMKKTIETRNTIPILACVSIQTGPNGPEMVATDLDLVLAMDLPESTLIGGGMVLMADALLKVLTGEDAAAPVTITMVPETKKTFARALLVLGDMDVELEPYPVEDFPTMHGMKNPAAPYTMAVGDFHLLAKTVMPSVSTEYTRYYLCGVRFGPNHLGPDTGKTAAVSTDGHRLTHVVLPWVWTGSAAEGILVPSKTMQIVQALTDVKGGARDDLMTFQTETKDATKLALSGPGWRILSKLIDGTFPDYTRVMPRDRFRGASTADAAEVKAAAQKIVRVASERSACVAVKAEDGILATPPNRDGDVKSVKIKLKTPPRPYGTQDSAPEFGVNGHYLTTAMDVVRLQSDTAVFWVQSAGDPVRIEPVSSTWFETILVLMPMRV